MANQVIVSDSGKGLYSQTIQVKNHVLAADEPVEYGGNDTGPSPYEFLLAALGACTSITIRFYAKQKNWSLSKVSVYLTIEKIHAEDCKDCETKVGKIDRIERKIVLEGDLDESQRAKLLEIANKCPVHRTLTSEVAIVTTVA